MTVDRTISMNFTVISLYSDDNIIRRIFFVIFSHGKSHRNTMKDCMTTFGTPVDTQWYKKGIKTSNWITKINKFDMKLKSKWAVSNAMTKCSTYFSSPMDFMFIRSINSLLLAQIHSRDDNSQTYMYQACFQSRYLKNNANVLYGLQWKYWKIIEFRITMLRDDCGTCLNISQKNMCIDVKFNSLFWIYVSITKTLPEKKTKKNAIIPKMCSNSDFCKKNSCEI